MVDTQQCIQGYKNSKHEVTNWWLHPSCIASYSRQGNWELAACSQLLGDGCVCCKTLHYHVSRRRWSEVSLSSSPLHTNNGRDWRASSCGSPDHRRSCALPVVTRLKITCSTCTETSFWNSAELSISGYSLKISWSLKISGALMFSEWGPPWLRACLWLTTVTVWLLLMTLLRYWFRLRDSTFSIKIIIQIKSKIH